MLTGHNHPETFVTSATQEQTTVILSPTRTSTEPLDLRKKGVAKDFNVMTMQNSPSNSFVLVAEKQIQDGEKHVGSARQNTSSISMNDTAERRPRYEITRWNEYGHIHGSQWARYNAMYNIGYQSLPSDDGNCDDSFCRASNYVLKAADEVDEEVESDNESLTMTPSKRNRSDYSRQEVGSDGTLSVHTKSEHTSSNTDEHDSEASTTKLRELHTRMMRVTRSDDDVGRRSQSHTETGSDVEDQSLPRLSHTSARHSSENLERNTREDAMSSQRRIHEDKNNQLVDGTQFWSHMMSVDRRLRITNTAPKTIQISNALHPPEQFRCQESNGRDTDKSRVLSRGATPTYESEAVGLRFPARSALPQVSSIYTRPQNEWSATHQPRNRITPTLELHDGKELRCNGRDNEQQGDRQQRCDSVETVDSDIQVRCDIVKIIRSSACELQQHICGEKTKDDMRPIHSSPTLSDIYRQSNREIGSNMISVVQKPPINRDVVDSFHMNPSEHHQTTIVQGVRGHALNGEHQLSIPTHMRPIDPPPIERTVFDRLSGDNRQLERLSFVPAHRVGEERCKNPPTRVKDDYRQYGPASSVNSVRRPCSPGYSSRQNDQLHDDCEYREAGSWSYGNRTGRLDSHRLNKPPQERERLWKEMINEEARKMLLEEQERRRLEREDRQMPKSCMRRMEESSSERRSPVRKNGERYPLKSKAREIEEQSRRENHDRSRKAMPTRQNVVQEKGRRQSGTSPSSSSRDRRSKKPVEKSMSKEDDFDINSKRYREVYRKESTHKYNSGDAGGDSSGGDSSDDDSERDSRRDPKDFHGKKRRDHKHDDDTDHSSDEEPTKTKLKSVSKPPKHWMKPDKFSGKSSWETFVCQFENCAKYNGWNARDKAAHLRWSMTDIAAQMLWGTEDYTYAQLIEKLGDRFGGSGIEEKFQHELRCRRDSTFKIVVMSITRSHFKFCSSFCIDS